MRMEKSHALISQMGPLGANAALAPKSPHSLLPCPPADHSTPLRLHLCAVSCWTLALSRPVAASGVGPYCTRLQARTATSWEQQRTWSSHSRCRGLFGAARLSARTDWHQPSQCSAYNSCAAMWMYLACGSSVAVHTAMHMRSHVPNRQLFTVRAQYLLQQSIHTHV